MSRQRFGIEHSFLRVLTLGAIALGGTLTAQAQFAGTPIISSFTQGALRNNFSGGFGMKFVVGSQPVNITALGRIDVPGNSASHLLRLVNAADGTDAPGGSVTVSLTAAQSGGFVYAALASPITLAAGSAWYVVSSETADGDQFYDLAPVISTSDMTIQGGVVYWPGVGFYVIGGGGLSYGPVNLLYTIAGPAPTVNVTSPAAGITASGNLTLAATAAAGTGLTVSKVQFLVDDANYGSPVSATPYSVVLDTTKLSNGSHTIAAIATDSALDSAVSGKVSITVHNVSTSVSITSPIDGSIVGGNQVVVAASAIPATNTTITKVQFQLDQTNYGAPVTASPYSITVDSTTLTDGPHTLAAQATDSAGATVASAPVNITVSNGVTTVAITAPTAGATVSGPNVVLTAAATARTGLTIGKVQFQVDGTNQGAALTAGPYTFTLDSTMLSNGPHTLVAIATDSSNIPVNSSPVAINVSNVAPPPVIPGTPVITDFRGKFLRNNFSGGFGMRFTVGATPVNVTALGRIALASNTKTHTVRLVTASSGVDVPGGSVTVSPAAGTPGQFVYTALASPVTLAKGESYYLVSDEISGADPFYDLGPVTSTSIITVNSGEVYWPGIGYYAVGGANSSYGPVSFLYIAAVAPPSVSISAPIAGLTVSGNAVTVTAAASAAAGLAIAKVQFQLDSVDYGAAVTAVPYTVTLDTTKLANGSHTLTAIATDTANSTNTSAPVGISVNNTPTAVSITAPTNGAAVSGNAVTVSASAIPAAGLTITSVQFQVDKVSYGTAVTTAPYTIQLDSTALSDGTHSLGAVATDSSAAKTTSASTSIVVNNSATSVSITSPVDGAVVSGSSVTVTATAVPRSGLTIARVQFQVDGANLGAAVAASPYSATLDSTTLSNGTHRVIAIATDSANLSVASGPVTISVSNGATPVPQGNALITSFAAGEARNNFTGSFGMKFTVGPKALNVTALGRIYIQGNTQSHLLKLVSAADSSDLPGGAANLTLPSGDAGQFAYAALDTPVTLPARSSWYLISSEVDGGDQFYNFGAVTADPSVNVNGAEIYWPSAGYYLIGGSNYSYGPVNLLFSVAP